MKPFYQQLKRSTGAALLMAMTLFGSPALNAQTTAGTIQTTAIGTSKTWGIVDGIHIIGLVQGPSATNTPLQVACVFEYSEGDIFNPPALPAPLNGMRHLDDALNGKITEIRKTGKFAGHALETLLITAPPGSGLKAQKLLLIGLGSRSQFTPELMESVGAVALREALRIGVTSFAFASDIKDGGIESPTAAVASYVTKGIINAYRVQAYLKQNKLYSYKPLTSVTLLAGPAFFNTAGEGIQQAIASFNN